MVSSTDRATGGSPFHAGELRAQARAGVRESVAPQARRIVRPYLPAQHRSFYEGLPFLVAAARDDRGRPWATLLTGRPGFVRAPDETSLRIEAAVPSGDALTGALSPGADVGLLGIDLATRRRNRVNGKLVRAGPPLRLDVAQAFGNCPQYIHPRDWRWTAREPARVAVSRLKGLSARARRWIESADTMFLASGYQGAGEGEAFGMDASHRGGPAGFVEVVSDTRLVFPDYAGNQLFNTVGNLLMDPRVGLLFVRFETGSLLQITGRASVDWNVAGASKHANAQRLVTIDVEDVVEHHDAVPLRWSAPREAVRSLRVVDKIRETEDVMSLLLASRDGGPLPDFRAGQHLPVEIRVPGHGLPLNRSYSLSNGPGTGRYRVSVKRAPRGVVSRYLHDSLEAGDILDAAAPAGDFVLTPGKTAVALVSAGIGITPMMSMLHQLADDPVQRPVWFIHGARDARHHAFAAQARSLAGSRRHITLHVAYSRPGNDERHGRDYHSEGRIDGDLIARLLPRLDADFYLCGPSGFLSELTAGLEHRGVAATRIHTEEFGGSF